MYSPVLMLLSRPTERMVDERFQALVAIGVIQAYVLRRRVPRFVGVVAVGYQEERLPPFAGRLEQPHRVQKYRGSEPVLFGLTVPGVGEVLADLIWLDRQILFHLLLGDRRGVL